MPVLIDKVAWVRIEDGRILCARSRGKDTCYLPGGKREEGESDVQTLVREIREELDVALVPETVEFLGAYEARAHGGAEGTVVRMSCYTGDHRGTPTASGEVEEAVWLTWADRDRVSPATRLVFADLRAAGKLG